MFKVPIFRRTILRPSRLLLPHLSRYSQSSQSPTPKYSHMKRKSKEEVFFPPVQLDGIQNKVALVTGGNDGIGMRCVRELLTCGAKGVMIADTNERMGYNEVLNFASEFSSTKVSFIQINPANYMLLKNAFISTISHYKGLDIVINNVKFSEKNAEDQVDEFIKGIVLSTQLSLEFMGRNNGGRGGILVNIASDYHEQAESCPLFLAVQDFIIRFDRSIARTYNDVSNVKVLTICKATFESIGCDLAQVITKGNNGCVWMP